MSEPPASGLSDKTAQGLDEKERAHSAPHSPRPPDPSSSGKDDERHQTPDPLVTGRGRREIGDSREPLQIPDNLWWQLGQGARSLKMSALAAIVVLAVDLFQPGHMKSWQVLGSVPLYFAGLLIFFSLERRDHRKQRASLPLDISSGGRVALILSALGFSTAADPTTAGLAGSLAFSALILGSASDGAWIALVAAQRRIGFWRALRELARKDREAQKHLWTALIGRSEP